MNNRREQSRLIANWNCIANAVNENSNIQLQLLNEELCDGISKVWLSFQYQNRGEEFNVYFGFLNNLNEKDIINIISLIKQQNENKFFNISFGNHKFPFRKLLDFLIAVNEAQKTSAETKFKGSIYAHWDANLMVACYPMQLTEYLKNSRVLHGNKLALISTPSHSMALTKKEILYEVAEEKNKQEKQEDIHVFFDSNGQETPCKNEEALAQALLTSLSWIKEDSIILLIFDEISYGDKNRELEDIFLNNEHLINEDPYMQTLVSQCYKGHISRRDTAYSLHYYLAKKESSGFTDLIEQLDKYLKEHPNNSQISKDVINDQSNVHKQSPLMKASEKGNLESVINLLKMGANLNVVDQYGWTALILASVKGHVAVVNALLAEGANLNIVNKGGWTALMCAARNGHVNIVNALLAKGANLNVVDKDGFTALMHASVNGHAAVVNDLFSKGVDLNLANKDGWTALMCAASNGHVNIVNALLAKGANLNAVDENGFTALMHASVNGHAAVVNDLFSKGVDLNLANKKDGWTALMCAASNGHVNIVNALLAKGADPNVASNDGRTALIFASVRGDINIVNTLLANGADVNLANKDGWTSLMCAADDGHVEIVNALLANGADVNLANNDGWTSLMLAANGEVANALLAKGLVEYVHLPKLLITYDDLKSKLRDYIDKLNKEAQRLDNQYQTEHSDEKKSSGEIKTPGPDPRIVLIQKIITLIKVAIDKCWNDICLLLQQVSVNPCDITYDIFHSTLTKFQMNIVIAITLTDSDLTILKPQEATVAGFFTRHFVKPVNEIENLANNLKSAIDIILRDALQTTVFSPTSTASTTKSPRNWS